MRLSSNLSMPRTMFQNVLLIYFVFSLFLFGRSQKGIMFARERTSLGMESQLLLYCICTNYSGYVVGISSYSKSISR